MIADIAAVPDTLDADVCIIGTGVIGLAIARVLMAADVSVVMLESGGTEEEVAVTSLLESEVDGPFHGAVLGRARRLGGTSTRWGGQALPMDAIDFERREWVPHSGWPIGLDEVAPYYRRADEYLGTDRYDYDENILALLRAAHPALDRDEFRYHVSKWAPNPRTIDLYRKDFERCANVRVVLHATATDLTLSPDGGTIEAVSARSLASGNVTVRARHVIVATGAIETARPLLVAGERAGRPIGTGHALIGRYLLDHPSGAIGTLRPRDERTVQRLFNMRYRGGRKYSLRLSLAAESQRRRRLLNISCGFNFAVPEGRGIDTLRAGLEAIRGRDPRRLAGATLNAARDLPTVAQWAWHRIAARRAYFPGATIGLVVNCEQMPSSENRVTLGRARDALGIPLSAIRWRTGNETRNTASVFAHDLAEASQAAGIGTIDLLPWVADPGGPDPLVDAYHPMGTARMATDPSTGVVDRDCRMFGINNMWIGGTAVFPTGGHSNPTYTGIALGIRLAERITAMSRGKTA